MKIKNRLIPIFLFILIFISISPLLINNVKAIDYEWIQNSGFEDIGGIEKVINGNIETVLPSAGWTVSSVSRSTAFSYSPSGSAVFDATNDYILFNFTSYYGESIPVGNIADIGLWIYVPATTQQLGFYINYGVDGDDSESGSILTFTTGAYGIWTHVNPLLNITLDSGKNVEYIKVMKLNSGTFYIDDVSLITYELGQSQITTNSEPWYSENENLGVNGDISSSLSHSGNYSMRLHYGIIALSVSQKINSLNVDNIQSFSCWVRFTVSGSKSFFITAYYSDGTYQQIRRDLASYGLWTNTDLSGCLVDGKILIKITLSIVSGLSTGDIYIDDVSLLANVPYGQSTFEISFFPQATTDNTGTYWLSVNQQYVVNGNLYDVNGTLSENGTYRIIGSNYFFITTGNMTFGTFQAFMPQRDFYESESFIFTVFVYNGSIIERSVTLNINVQWFSGDFGDVSPSPSVSPTPYDYQTQTPFLSAYAIGGMVLTLVFSLLFGAYAGKDGLLTGIILGIFISAISGLFPSYSLIVAVIIGIILIVSHTGIPSTSTGGG